MSLGRGAFSSRGKLSRRHVSKINGITVTETLGQEELQGCSWTLVLGFASGNTEPGLGIVMSQSFSFQHLIKHHLLREAFTITLLKLGIPCYFSIIVQCVCVCARAHVCSIHSVCHNL